MLFISRKYSIHQIFYHLLRGNHGISYLQSNTKRKIESLENTGKIFKLAGYNLIYKLWVKRDKPTNQGWHISADDLIREFSSGNETYENLRFVIDFHPSAKWRIGLIELLDIYVYTWQGSQKNQASWSPMMLRFHDIMYEEFKNEITEKKKATKISLIDSPAYNDDFVEFLYLNGDDKSWNWGMNGMTNAAFIHGAARDYFRQFF